MIERILIGFLFAFFVLVIPYALIRPSVYGRKKQEALKEAAEKKNHRVTAHLKKTISGDITDTSLDHREWKRSNTGIYEYTFNNKNYRITKFFDEDPPETLTLYFVDNPRKADVEGRILTSRKGWIIAFAVLFALMFWAGG